MPALQASGSGRRRWTSQLGVWAAAGHSAPVRAGLALVLRGDAAPATCDRATCTRFMEPGTEYPPTHRTDASPPLPVRKVPEG